MRIDIVSIFPDYLAPLELSLPGKAREKGLLEIAVHDLRTWTHDRHHTVDDTPYGGGAGMVMKADVWGAALDEVLSPDAILIVPTPSGEPFTQQVAAELAEAEHLVFACGRYEGIDQRVMDHYRGQVREVSIGDYVLNGGEVAALAICEAVVRLLPGFMGNAESLAEESHGESGLLEYPVFTKPASWRGLDVPEVLLSGNHAAIAQWRHQESLRRTLQRRPDLAHASRALELPEALADASGTGGGWQLRRAVPADAGELLTLQRACWLQEVVVNQTWEIPAVREDFTDVLASIREWHTWVLRTDDRRLVGSVRGLRVDDAWEIGRLMVAPDLQGHGLGRLLLEHIESVTPQGVTSLVLYAGALSSANHRRYKRAGYRLEHTDPAGYVRLRKRV